MIHSGVLEYKKSRYLWWSLFLVVVCIVLFVSQRGTQPANGGTWQGYTIGTLGALIILWLSILGLRKRMYKSSLGSVAGWTSAHVYLGVAVIIIGTLHSAGQLGWNIHTLPYVLMIIVVVSGMIGMYYYISLPQKSLLNRGGKSRDQLFSELFELDEKGAEVANNCSVEISLAATSAISKTTIGGGLMGQLRRSDKSSLLVLKDGKQQLVSNADQSRILSLVSEQIPNAVSRAEVEPLRELLSIMSRRQAVVRRIVRDIQFQALLKIWLYFHVPVTVALIVALLIHIVSTFFYW